MSASILDGKYVASILQNSMKQQLMAHMQTSVRQPGLRRRSMLIINVKRVKILDLNHSRIISRLIRPKKSYYFCWIS